MTLYTLEQFVAREAAIVEAGAQLVGPSMAERFSRLPPAVRQRFIHDLSPLDAARLLYDWRFWARPKQRPPGGDWVLWLLLGGRGLGKNRTGAEWMRDEIKAGRARPQSALVGPDWKDVRRYMVGGQGGQGSSGLLDVFPPWERKAIRFFEQKAEIHFERYGTVVMCNTAEQKELRGANLRRIWGDEIIKWRYAEELWNNIELTLRSPGADPPRIVITTTPQPMDLLRDLIMDSGTVTTHGTTYENASNLHTSWLDRMRRRYGQTRVGLQELEARILGDNPGALFHMSQIDTHRVPEAPELTRILVGVDPAVSRKRSSDETGIVVVGVDRDCHLYVLADASAKHSPGEWARKAIELATLHAADGFVIERNKIGEMAAHNIRRELQASSLSGEYEIHEAYSAIDKPSRAAPVAALYERGTVHHVGRQLGDLEAEITSWDPQLGRSPNRLDALVHACYELAGLADDKPDPSTAMAGMQERNRRLAAYSPPRRLV